MINELVTGLLTSALLLANPGSVPPKASSSVQITQVLPDANLTLTTVGEGDTMNSIAKKYYGSEDYWTTLWNDNSDIISPSSLEQGKTIKIRKLEQVFPEALNSELENRLSAEVKERAENEYNAYSDELSKQSSESASLQSAAPSGSVAQIASPKSLTEDQIISLGSCEAGMNPATNSGNGYYGAFQFSQETWRSMNTGYDRADLAPIEVQKEAVQRLVARSSVYTQFPACSQRMRNAGII